MKKKLLWIPPILIVMLLLGAAATDTQLTTSQAKWVVAESCTSADAEATALAVGERTFQTILAAIRAASVGVGDGEIQFYTIPNSTNSIRVTAIGITNDGTYTVDIHAGTLGVDVDTAIRDGTDCNMTKIGTLAFIIGQQTAVDPDKDTGYEMAQSVTVTSLENLKTWVPTGTVDSDRTCEAALDVVGADVLVIVPTTCSADSKLLIKGF